MVHHRAIVTSEFSKHPLDWVYYLFSLTVSSAVTATWWALLESVDCWPMAIISFPDIRGQVGISNRLSLDVTRA